MKCTECCFWDEINKECLNASPDGLCPDDYEYSESDNYIEIE